MAITKYKKKKNVGYKAELWFKNRRIETKCFRRKLDAEYWLRSERQKLENGGKIKDRKIKFSEFTKDECWSGMRLRDSTLVDYRRIVSHHILPSFGHREVHDVSATEWKNLFTALEKKNSPARCNRIQATISSIYKAALKIKVADVNPIEEIEWREEDQSTIDYWSKSEITDFLFWAEHSNCNFYLLYRLAYETGLRVSEIIALNWDIVDLDNNRIVIKRTWSKITKKFLENTKSKKPRVVGINVELAKLLRLKKRSSMSNFVFARSTNEHLTYDMIRSQFARDQKKAGVRIINFHALRHTMASHFVMNGGSLSDLKFILGHSSYETTLQYAHFDDDHIASQSKLVAYKSPDLSGPRIIRA